MAKHRTPVAPRFIRSACYYKLIIHVLLSYSSQTATFIFIKNTSRSLSLYPGCISVYFVIWNSNTDESVVLSLCWTRETVVAFLHAMKKHPWNDCREHGRFLPIVHSSFWRACLLVLNKKSGLFGKYSFSDEEMCDIIDWIYCFPAATYDRGIWKGRLKKYDG